MTQNNHAVVLPLRKPWDALPNLMVLVSLVKHLNTKAKERCSIGRRNYFVEFTENGMLCLFCIIIRFVMAGC